jgi:hypothetical protein
LKLSQVRAYWPLALFAVAGTGTVAAMATAGIVAVTTTPASAATSGQASFCQSFARFGDSPGYRNFTAMHASAAGADATARRGYGRFQSALLAGMPRPVLRTDVAAVYAACRPAATVSFGMNPVNNPPMGQARP